MLAQFDCIPKPWIVVHVQWQLLQGKGIGYRLWLKGLSSCRRADLGMLLAVLAAVSRGSETQRAAAAHAALQTPDRPGTVCSADAAEYITLLKVSAVTSTPCGRRWPQQRRD